MQLYSHAANEVILWSAGRYTKIISCEFVDREIYLEPHLKQRETGDIRMSSGSLFHDSIIQYS
jgi:hypothetical protein